MIGFLANLISLRDRSLFFVQCSSLSFFLAGPSGAIVAFFRRRTGCNGSEGLDTARAQSKKEPQTARTKS